MNHPISANEKFLTAFHDERPGTTSLAACTEVIGYLALPAIRRFTALA